MRVSHAHAEELVRDFQIKFGHFFPEKTTTDLPDGVLELRIRLINEEFIEFMGGLTTRDLVEIADGAADLVYVAVGACIAHGIPFDRVFMEVHRSNMTKDNVKVSGPQKYGTKTPKGPNYIPPDIGGILFEPWLPTALEIIAEREEHGTTLSPR